jgi:hypothetical protein
MTMMDESEIREQLERAVDVIEPVAPPLDALRSRARRLGRMRRTGWGTLAVAAVAVIVLIVVVVVPGGGNKQTLQPAKAPTHASLVSFASDNHALKQIAGPYQGEDGSYYGSFATKTGIVLATYHGAKWHQSGPTIMKLGAGRWIMRLAFWPGLGRAATPSVYVRVMGGDITYAGSILRRVAGSWRTAAFGRCGMHGSAYGGLCPSGDSEPYLHRAAQGLVSVNNNCTPSCAAGNQYRVRWVWNATLQRFVATKVTKVVR